MKVIKGTVTPPRHKLAIVVSRFNEELTQVMLANALQRCQEIGVLEKNIIIVHVPGAVEIAITGHLLAKNQDIEAVICLGAVIKGETAHFEYVSKACTEGCNQVMLTHSKPVIMGVITAYTYEQARARTNGETMDIGREVVDIACEMCSTCAQISQINPPIDQ